MGRYYCSNGCGYFEDGYFDDMFTCSNGDCMQVSEGTTICSRCIIFNNCSSCGTEKCEVCMPEEICDECEEGEEIRKIALDKQRKKDNKQIDAKLNATYRSDDENDSNYSPTGNKKRKIGRNLLEKKGKISKNAEMKSPGGGFVRGKVQGGLHFISIIQADSIIFNISCRRLLWG